MKYNKRDTGNNKIIEIRFENKNFIKKNLILIDQLISIILKHELTVL